MSLTDRTHSREQRRPDPVSARKAPKLPQAVLDAYPDAVFVCSSTGVIEQANVVAHTMFGYGHGALIGRSIDELVPHRLREAHVGQREAFAIAPSPLSLAARPSLMACTQGGTEFPVSVNLAPFDLGNGPRVLCTVHNASETLRLRDEIRRLTETRRPSEPRVLQSSDARWQSLVEGAPQNIQVVDRDGRIAFINWVFPGLRREDVIGRMWADFVPSEYAGTARDALTRVFEHETTVSFETAVRDPSGSTRWYSTTVGPIRRDGSPIEAVSISSDVTQQRRAEQCIRSLVEGLSGVTGVDFFQQLVTQLARALDVSHAVVARLVDTNTVRALASWGDDPALFDALIPIGGTVCARVAAGEHVRIARGARSEYPDDVVLARCETEGYIAVPMVDKIGRATGMLCVLHRGSIDDPELAEEVLRLFAARAGAELQRVVDHERLVDFTQSLEARVHARTADLAESEERQRTLTQWVHDAVITANESREITSWNRAAEQVFGIPEAGAIGRSLTDAIGLAADHIDVGRFDPAAEAGTDQPIDVVLRGNKARTFLAEVSVATWKHLEQRFVTVVLRDVSEERAAQSALDARTEELSRANADIARAARMKDEFLANMSHELRTPLNAILGMSEALQEDVYGPLTPRQRTSLRTIEESGRQLLELINDILDLSKIEAGKLTLEFGVATVRAVCDSCIALVREAAGKKSLRLTLECDAQTPTVWADKRRLKQMLVNLLSNAVKFTPSGGSVGLAVTGRPDDRAIDFTVWDTGIGISTDDFARLFRPFGQLDTGLARQYAGSGLGLSLVQRIADLHGGHVGVTSEPGQGSRFTVCLPWEPPDEAPAVVPVTGPVSTRRPRLSTPGIPMVLLAEDNELNVATLEGYLTARGYRVTVARNGIEALARLAEYRPAMVIMDVQMPLMDGLQAIREIRQRADGRRVPILALTALAMPGDRERCLAAGADEYLAKPVSLKRLTAVLQQFHKGRPTHD